jgi:excisionase family DNA binding protein
MTETTLPNIWTLKEVAEYLKVHEEIVLGEIEKGVLHGFRIGGEWRLSDNDLLTYINSNYSKTVTEENHEFDAQEFDTQETQNELELNEIGAFDFQWPQGVEHFDEGYTVIHTVNGRTVRFRIGFTYREAAGEMRRRAVVWMDERPLVEFAGSNDYESNGLLASVIKLRTNKQLRPYQNIPKEYKEFRVARYDSIVRGRFASRNMAIIVHKNDFRAMLKHAVIRAIWKELI